MNNNYCGMKIICAFSGGPDSVFLAFWLKENFADGEIIIAHFNHHLRGEESDADEKFCKNFAEENNFTFVKGDWKNPQNSEEKARNARYNFLETTRKKFSAEWICTGHHRDDVAETVLLQFLRGGGLPALAGIAEKNTEKKLWRPLLQISKTEILETLEEKKIAYRVDSSNLQNNYTRNFLRNEIIPELEKKFPKISDRIAKKTKYFYEVQNILEDMAENFLLQNSLQKGIERGKFFAEKFPIRCEIMKKIFPQVSWTQEKFSTLENFLHDAQSGKKFVLKGGAVEVFGKKFFITELLKEMPSL